MEISRTRSGKAYNPYQANLSFTRSGRIYSDGRVKNYQQSNLGKEKFEHILKELGITLKKVDRISIGRICIDETLPCVHTCKFYSEGDGELEFKELKSDEIARLIKAGDKYLGRRKVVTDNPREHFFKKKVKIYQQPNIEEENFENILNELRIDLENVDRITIGQICIDETPETPEAPHTSRCLHTCIFYSKDKGAFKEIKANEIAELIKVADKYLGPEKITTSNPREHFF